jgi:hypothetical protein
MDNPEGPAHDPPIPDRSRHISVEERDGVPLGQFVDLRIILERTGSLQGGGQEFRMMASNRQKTLVDRQLTSPWTTRYRIALNLRGGPV